MSTEVTYRVLAGGEVVLSHKQCSRCTRLLPRLEFASNADRRRSMCRDCSAYIREQRFLASLGFINLLTEELAS